MYPSDLTDEQWALLEPYFERSDPRAAVSKYPKMDIANAIMYVIKGGIQWRMLPKDMPPWPTVYDHFYRLRQRGVWDQILADVTKMYRLQAGRSPNPTYELIDAQSFKTQYRGEKRGFAGDHIGQLVKKNG